jgi:hypothetical protein
MMRAAPNSSDDERQGELVASGRPIETTPLVHPVLGPAVTVYCDRRQALANLFLDLAFLCVALVGLVLGLGDVAGTNSAAGGLTFPPIVGVAQVAAAFVVGVWSIRAGVRAIGRMRNTASLVVGRDGFEFRVGDGPVGWDEVDSIGDRSSPDDQPRNLRVQLKDPGEYASRHSLSPVGRLLSLLNRRDLVLGHDTIMPLGAVQDLMRKRLSEFRGMDSAPATVRAASSRPARRRRQGTRK